MPPFLLFIKLEPEISPPTLHNNVTSSKPDHALISLHFWHHSLPYRQQLPPLSTPLTLSSPHSLHFGHHLPYTLCTTDTTSSPHLHQVSLLQEVRKCFLYCAWGALGVCERERYREREREIQRERERWKWRHLNSAEIGEEICTFPCQNAEIGEEFCIFPCQKFVP